MEKQFISLFAKLWHPYRKPEGTHVNQSIARGEDYFANSPNLARPDWVNSGL